VGRNAEVAAAVGELLCQDDVRLLTLTGAGGIGKTRLAVQVATERRGQFRHGAVFVGLASIREPSLVPAAIAQVFGVRDEGERPVVERLSWFLHDRTVLLLLDNFEHVLEAASAVVELLASCPTLTVLVTSQAPLRVAGEQTYPVPPLELPDPVRTPEPADLARTDAVSLFARRAFAADPRFSLDESNTRVVAEICARLDGLPLAIELAAARSRVFSPAALLARLTHRLDVLAGGVRDAPARQQTMRGAIAWSYDLLSEEQRLLCRRFSVFVGGFDISAAENVAGEVAGEVIAGLGSLIDFGIVRRQEDVGGEPRFRMLETIREFGLERLAGPDGYPGDGATTRRRHAEWCLILAEQTEREFLGVDDVLGSSRVDSDQANLRGALAWAAQAGEPELLLRLAGALWWYWMFHGHLTEGRGWLERARVAEPAVPDGARAKALFGAGMLASVQGDATAGAAMAHPLGSWQRPVRPGRPRAWAWSKEARGQGLQQGRSNGTCDLPPYGLKDDDRARNSDKLLSILSLRLTPVVTPRRTRPGVREVGPRDPTPVATCPSG